VFCKPTDALVMQMTTSNGLSVEVLSLVDLFILWKMAVAVVFCIVIKLDLTKLSTLLCHSRPSQH